MDIDSDNGSEAGSMIHTNPATTPVKFSELEDIYGNAPNSCWLCTHAFRKSIGGSGPNSSPLMDNFYNTYMTNREHMNLRQLALLLETNYMEYIYTPLYDSGKLDVHRLGREEIEMHLRAHTIDPIQTILNETHDLVIEIEALKDSAYIKRGDQLVLNLDASRQLAKSRELKLRYQTFLATQRRT